MAHCTSSARFPVRDRRLDLTKLVDDLHYGRPKEYREQGWKDEEQQRERHFQWRHFGSPFSVLTPLGGEFGVRNRVGVLPAVLGAHGIVHVRVPALSTRERVLLETALGG